MRIATVLLALADLAERASTRSRPVLCLVLCLLRPAEALARRFAVEVSPTAALPVFFFDSAAEGAFEMRLDALRLAMAFRLLAAVLGGLVAAGPPSSGPSHPRRYEAHDPPAGMWAGQTPAAADTS